ncbi:hypothetical protein GBAR_LOCUS25045, partial [Geodia barretti]
ILWRRGRGYPLTHAHNIVGVVDCYRVCVFVLFFPPFNQLLQLVALQGVQKSEWNHQIALHRDRVMGLKWSISSETRVISLVCLKYSFYIECYTSF